MPRYFFEASDGNTVVQETKGLSLDGIEAARDEARKTLRDLARDIIPDDGDRGTMTVKVHNETGKVVVTATVTFQIETAS